MDKEQKIFDAAMDYDFESVRIYAESGGNLNICNERGYSLLTCFVVVLIFLLCWQTSTMVSGYLRVAYEVGISCSDNPDHSQKTVILRELLDLEILTASQKGGI